MSRRIFISEKFHLLPLYEYYWLINIICNIIFLYIQVLFSRIGAKCYFAIWLGFPRGVIFQVSKDLMRLGPDLIHGLNLVTPPSLPQNKKRDDSIFRDAFQDLLQITPDIFQETVVGDLGSKMPAQHKGNGVSRKKKLLGWFKVMWS